MKKAEILKLPLLSIQEAIGSPKVSALLKVGYEVAAVIPVEDEGQPTLFLVMTPKNRDRLAIMERVVQCATFVAIAVLCVLTALK